ncbi:MAG TPA: GNAT family N-acetyltransferase [Gaiellaceae bacterium]|nr:GNAT family N-acetyltransferase [Gaiellaceae bacterium]
MHTRIVKPKHGPEILVRPLRAGDTATVLAVFERLGDESRRARFNGPKWRLGEKELRWLATVGPGHHALVAWADGDSEPVAIARLVRIGAGAEIAFEVADAYQGRGIGSALTRLLVADALAAGIREVTALVRSDNPAAIAMLRRVLGRLELRIEGPDLLVRAPLPASG